MAKAKSKLYAIKSGVHPVTKEPVKNLVLNTTWAEAEPYIKGVKNAEYKSFTSEEDVQRYFNGGGNEPDPSVENPDALYCYVDGSFNKDIPNYSFGLVCVKGGKVIHHDRGLGNNTSALETWQIAGELLGSIKALLYAKSNQTSEVFVHHDYMGVKMHSFPVKEGGWKRSTPVSETYFQWVQDFREKNPNIKFGFVKVEAHTGNDFNEIADGLAKLAVGLKPEPVFYRMVEKHNVQV